MGDSFGKYLRLFGTLFFTFIGFILALVLLFLGVRLFFGLLSYISWINYLYVLLILMFPASLFMSAYIIFFVRTRSHPSKPVRIISYLIFSGILISWIIFFISDLMLFFKYFYNSIEKYQTYNLLFLSINVGCLFLVGVIQALSTEKEKDWMQRRVQ